MSRQTPGPINPTTPHTLSIAEANINSEGPTSMAKNHPIKVSALDTPRNGSSSKGTGGAASKPVEGVASGNLRTDNNLTFTSQLQQTDMSNQ